MNNKDYMVSLIVFLCWILVVAVSAYSGYCYASFKWEIKLSEAEARFASKKLDNTSKQSYAKSVRDKQKGNSNDKKDIDCVTYLSLPVPDDCLLHGGRWITSGK